MPMKYGVRNLNTYRSMRNILQVITDKIRDRAKRREEEERLASEREEQMLAKEFCYMDDRGCIPTIMVGDVPFYTVSDEATDLAAFTVNIKDVEHVVNTIRVKFIEKSREKKQ